MVVKTSARRDDKVSDVTDILASSVQAEQQPPSLMSSRMILSKVRMTYQHHMYPRPIFLEAQAEQCNLNSGSIWSFSDDNKVSDNKLYKHFNQRLLSWISRGRTEFLDYFHPATTAEVCAILVHSAYHWIAGVCADPLRKAKIIGLSRT